MIINGNSLHIPLADNSVQMCVTSPPYYGLRDYGVDGQLGLEQTPEQYIANMVHVFREVRRVMKDDGVLWVNIGDSYAGSGKGRYGDGEARPSGKQATNAGSGLGVLQKSITDGCKPKDLIGIPWLLAFALRADGWYLRCDIIWSKPNPMPESVTDRPTKAHEYIFLLSKSERYFYDAEAIVETSTTFKPEWANKVPTKANITGDMSGRGVTRTTEGLSLKPAWEKTGETRNKRSVWSIATHPYEGAHFATFPPKLIEPCILAGSREGDIVLDCFNGSGTTGMVAMQNNRRYVGIELNPAYIQLTQERLDYVQPRLMFAEVAA